MATETVVHDPRKRSMDAIHQRLQKDQLRQQQQQQQQNEKDKKRASDDVNVSSKEPHKPHSLPTPPTKKPITKGLFFWSIHFIMDCDIDWKFGFVDPQDDGFAAYTKLSHPVDEKLLATNVKVEITNHCLLLYDFEILVAQFVCFCYFICLVERKT